MTKLTTKGQQWLAANHPELVLFHRPDRSILEGSFRFNRSFDGVKIEDAYEIRLELPYANDSLPRLTEPGGRLRAVLAKHPEYGNNPVHLHIYSNWNLCLAAPQELRLRYLPDSDIQVLFEQYIEPYFYSQSFFEQHDGNWPWQHLPHNLDGILEWFRNNHTLPGATRETAVEIHKLAKKKPESRAARMVAHARRRDGFTPHNRCLCGRKRSYLQCHPSYSKLALALR